MMVFDDLRFISNCWYADLNLYYTIETIPQTISRMKRVFVQGISCGRTREFWVLLSSSIYIDLFGIMYKSTTSPTMVVANAYQEHFSLFYVKMTLTSCANC